ncbi:hypothetical protein GCM10010309_72720 [Streptomyces violaceochromogenes]|nr:hypothetical protein GCM10010309_72720 [Streptomyces violaceochromogenes]
MPHVAQFQSGAALGGLVQDGGGQGAVGAEEAGLAVVVGYEVPDAGFVDEAIGIEGVGGHAVVASVPVAQAQAPVGEGSLLEGGEIGSVRTRLRPPVASTDRLVKHMGELGRSLQEHERAVLLVCFLHDNPRLPGPPEQPARRGQSTGRPQAADSSAPRPPCP